MLRLHSVNKHSSLKYTLYTIVYYTYIGIDLLTDFGIY
jgi:hypothetical protein